MIVSLLFSPKLALIVVITTATTIFYIGVSLCSVAMVEERLTIFSTLVIVTFTIIKVISIIILMI